MYIYKVYQTTVRWYLPCVALPDEGSCLLIQSPESSSTQVLSPPWNKGHISWSRSHLFIKVISIDQVLIYDNQVHIYLSRSHLSFKVTFMIKVTSIYPKSHLFLMVTSLFLCLMICYKSHTFLLRSHSNLFLSHLSVCV